MATSAEDETASGDGLKEDSLANRVRDHRQAARQTLKQTAREGLLAAILAGRLKPGEKLRQKELAEGLGISITPVREALNELSAEGFVHLDPHRGAVVRKISEADWIEAANIMEALIPLSARLIAENITEAELHHATELQDTIEQVTDVTEFIRLNTVFHNFLTSCTRAPRLNGIVVALRASQTVMLNVTVRTIEDRLAQANREHRALLAALAARDAEMATECMMLHTRPNREAVHKFFEEQERRLNPG